MPVILDPDSTTQERLVSLLPPGTQAVSDMDALLTHLEQALDDYAVVIGPHVDLDEALVLASELRLARPVVSPILVRTNFDAETLRQAIHSGVRDVVTVGDTPALTGAIERAYQLFTALRQPLEAQQTEGRVISVFSPKGGVGKTTTAVNLAMALRTENHATVCIVDMDLAFGDVAITMQLFPTHSIEHAIGSEQTMDYSILRPLLTAHDTGVQVLAAPSLPDARDRITPALVSKILRTLRSEFDYIVIDTAPAFDEQTLTALDETDECVIIATLDVPTLKNVKVALETMDVLSIAVGHRHLVVNRADDAVGITSDKVSSILGMPVSLQSGSSMDVAAATNAGRPIQLAKPDHAFSKGMRRLTKIVAGDDAAASPAKGHRAAEKDKGKRLFGRRK